MVMAFVELDAFELIEVSPLSISLPAKKPGYLGRGRSPSLLSIITTKDMVGLSCGSS